MFGILLLSQLLFTHLPAMTNDGGMMAILWKDHELFENLNSCHEDIKEVVVALGGKKKKSTKIETDDKDY